MVRYTGWYDHTSTAQSELTWDLGLWGWCRAKASCCFILKSWVKHRGKNKIKPCLKFTWNLRRKGKSYSDFSSVKLDGVLLNALCQKNQTPVILRLFKRAGDREPVLPEALPKPQLEADADVRKLLGLSCLLRDWQSLWHHPCAQHGSVGVFHWLWWELAEVLSLSDVLMC